MFQKHNFKKLILFFIILSLCIPMFFPALEIQATNTWNHQIKKYKDVQNGSFDNMIWDDTQQRFQLHGKTLYEDFSMYNNTSEMGSQGWTFRGHTDPANNRGILKYGNNHQLSLSRTGYYTQNLSATREFSPTRSGEVEFIFTPISGASRVAIDHYPAIELESGYISTQFMFRFQPSSDGGNEIRFGTNRGYAIKGKEYDTLKNAFTYGEPQHIKITWDLEERNGVNVYLNGRLVVKNFYKSMTTPDLYFHQVSLTVGEGGYPLKGTPGKAKYDFVSLKQSFNQSGTYTSEPIKLTDSTSKILEEDIIAEWDQHLPTGTSVEVETRISRSGGKYWGGWTSVSNGESILKLQKGNEVDRDTRLQYRVQMESLRNNISPWLKNLSFKTAFDETSPELELNMSTEDWTNDDVIVEVEANDNVEVDYITLPNGTTVNSKDVSYTIGDNGDYTFEVKDTAGNETIETITISNIDKGDPILNVTQNPMNWTNQNVELQIVASDEGSGVKILRQIDGAETTENRFHLSVDRNGTYEFEVVDKAGNRTTETIVVANIDKEEPVIEVTGNPTKWTNEDVTLNIQASDTGGSQLKHIKLPNGTITTSSQTIFKISENKRLLFIVKDYAGNEKSLAVEVTKIDKRNPNVNIGETYRNNNKVDVKLDYGDE